MFSAVRATPPALGPGGTRVIAELVVCDETESRFVDAVLLLAVIPAAAGWRDAFSDHTVHSNQ